MNKSDSRYEMYINILKEELVPAMGCTEPICLAYAAAKAREVLGGMPDKVDILASGNIIKNVKSVIVPNTNGMKGLKASVAIGVIGGDPEKKLEVIAGVTEEQKEEARAFLEKIPMSIAHIDSKEQLDVTVRLHKNEHFASVRIANFHTNIVHIQKDNEVIFKSDTIATPSKELTDRSILSMEGIYDFANSVDIEDIKEIIGRQLKYNKAISEEGLKNDWGANIGRLLLTHYSNNVRIKAKAWAAAGSDARMNGCEMPVIINSGSGNQGITASMPVLAYAQEFNIDEERLYRALVVSNLTAIHQKTLIGRLSAYCGAISAGCAAGCGVAYLLGEDFETISQTLSNSLAITSGVICDGAKASCAAKIATAVDSGLMGYYMCKNKKNFCSGDGIVGDGIEKTIKNVGKLASQGMRETDKVIIEIMTE